MAGESQDIGDTATVDKAAWPSKVCISGATVPGPMPTASRGHGTRHYLMKNRNQSPTMNPKISPPPYGLYRRDFLLHGGAGFGALALSYLLKDNPLFAAPADPARPLAPHPGHH